eukprot:c2531_g1_i2.p1 GENE.c2531_g1_i2~~c2531_g1_i2.p1  ORF type:complete len:619 (+),score=139.90 c2531_g1_i2:186-1859(+)
MTTIPKPLKYLKEHYGTLKNLHQSTNNENKVFLADVLSVMGITMAQEGSCESLKFRLQGTNDMSWGHEYIRHLCSELVTEWARLSDASESTNHLLQLATDIVKYHMAHNAESEAVDLLLEIGHLEDMLVAHIDPQNSSRVVRYLMACSSYLPPDESVKVRRVCVTVLRAQGYLTEALRTTMMLNDRALATEIFTSTNDPLVQKQMALMLGSQHIFLEIEDDELLRFMNNEHLSENFLNLARELDVLEPKLPEDVFKNMSDRSGPVVDSATMNLASTLVNALVNAGFAHDKLMNVHSSVTQASDWVYKNKDHGMVSAVASVGMIMMWDVNNGLGHIDRYMYTDKEHVTAGALLACGVVNASVRNEVDPALALLGPQTSSPSAIIRSCALLGLGIAYAGSAREDVRDFILPTVADSEVAIDVACVAALALGLTFTGSANAEIAETIIQAMLERQAVDLKHPLSRLFCLALGLVYLGKGEEVDLTLETCNALDPCIAEFCSVVVESCAYAASGNVLHIQKLLEIAGRHQPKKEGEDAEAEDKAAVGSPNITFLILLVSQN